MSFAFNNPELSEKEKSKVFLDELQKFYSHNGKSSVKVPLMGGKELDLYKLFKEVVSRGGCNFVLENKLWKDVVNSIEIPASCTSASFLLKNHYSKCLLAYENFYMKNQNKAIGGNSQSVNKSNNPEVPQGVHIQPGNSLEQKFLGKKIQRTETSEIGNLIFRVTKPYMLSKENKEKIYIKKVRLMNAIPDLKRVVLAFESHSSQEILWSINILLLFSSNQNCSLILENQPYLIESISNYLYYCINNISEFYHLFSSNLKDKDGKTKKDNNILNEMLVNSTTNLPTLSKKEKSLDGKEKMKSQLDIVNSVEEVMEYELLEHLISLIQIIRNLSFIRPNEPTIVKCSKLMNIIYMLFINSFNIEIKSNCLDILSNLSKHIILKDVKNGQAILDQVYVLTKSPLKEISEQALECLRRMTFPVGNEEFFEKLEDSFYEEMVNLLISFKSEIRETALEILYCISDQMLSKVKLGKIPNCIERLIGLLCVSSNDNRIAKFSACILSNLSIIPFNQKLIMPYEEQIFLAACVDESLTKTLMGIISN